VAGIPIGKLLVEQGILTPAQVEQILDVQRMSHRPFGDLAERLFGVEPRAVEDAWVEQYVARAGATNLDLESFDPTVRDVLNARQAWQFQLLPIRRDADHFHVATTAAKLVRSVNFVTRKFNEPVHFIIASPRQLRQYLMEMFPVPQHVADYAAAM
jgi:hypothetical protein